MSVMAVTTETYRQLRPPRRASRGSGACWALRYTALWFGWLAGGTSPNLEVASRGAYRSPTAQSWKASAAHD